MFKHHFQLVSVLIFILSTLPVLADFDQQRPDGVSDEKWSSLKTVVQEAKLLPTPAGIGGSGSQFGHSVSVDGDRALVGAPFMLGSGVVYVMDYDGESWVESTVLTPSDGEQGDQFGHSVSLSGDRVLVGAYQSSGVTAISGSAYVYDFDGSAWNETIKLAAGAENLSSQFGISVSLLNDRALIGANRDNGQNVLSGSAYIFDFDGNNWSITAKLTAADGSAFDKFGHSVSLSDDRAVIGASEDEDNGTDSGSAYVFDFDGLSWSETIKFTASDGAAEDKFGSVVSLSGNRIVVGAYEDDDLGSNSGSAYVFDFDGSNWSETTKLTASDGAINDSFGFSVSLAGNRVMIGSYRDGNQGFSFGSAYVFDFNGSSWIESSKLIAADQASLDGFGYSVSLSGDRAFIAAPFDDDLGDRSGSSYVFDFDGSNWSETAKLTAADGASHDLFGYSVSLSGNRAMIGAPRDDDQANDSGSAYVFDFNGSSWVQTAKLTASDGAINDTFGWSVSLSGDRALIGAFKDDDQGTDSGSAYVFDFDGNSWNETIKLTATDGASEDWMGYSVNLSGDRALIGAYRNDDRGSNSGSVYVFDFDGNNWSETTKLTATLGSANDQFGISVSLSGNRALVGANGDDDHGTASGSVYIFDFDGNSWSETTKLTAVTDGAAYDQFGISVSLLGDRALVGAFGDNDLGNASGVAYVFDFDGSSWIETTKLTAVEGASTGDNQGVSVSLSHDRALMGAYYYNVQGSDSSSAYVFDFDGSKWSDSSKLVAADAQGFDYFGGSVSISGDRVLVGSHRDDDHGTDSGSAYVFNLNKTYTIGGNVTGLVASNSVELQNNLGDNLSINADGGFTFPIGLKATSDYSVTVLTQPITPNQTCLVTGGSNMDGTGTIAGANVIDITVTCTTNQYNININVTGLLGDGVSFSNGTDTLTMIIDGVQSISTLDDGSAFDLEITDQPEALNQVCSFTSPDTGILAGNDVTVNIECVTVQYSIGVTVSGLESGNTLVLQNNGSDDLTIATNGFINFPTTLDDGSIYDASVMTQPTKPNQFCQLNQASGVINGADVDSITVVCVTDVHTVGGGVTGLATNNSVTLSINGGDEFLLVNDNTNFEFINPLEDSSAYDVTVFNQPTSPNQTCAVTNGSGTLMGADVSNIEVECSINQYFIGGYVVDLIPDNYLVLQNNGTNDLVITEAGAFVFSAPHDDQQPYAVSIEQLPHNPIQPCELINGAGNLNGNDVDNVLINCEFGDDLIYRHGFDTPESIGKPQTN